MALSNWDTLSLDLDGHPTAGIFTAPDGSVVRFYKNWIYIQDKQAWYEGSFQEPTIVELMQGEIHYRGTRITAVRGPQEGIYAVVLNGYDEDLIGMIGCGVYGFKGGNWIGVEAKAIRFLESLVKRHEIHDERAVQTILHEIVPSKRAQCEKILREPIYEFPEKVRTLDFSRAMRFNQGDAYLLGNAEAASTQIGKAHPTILSRVFESEHRESLKLADTEDSDLQESNSKEGAQ